MDIKFKNQFIEQWKKYFGEAELPIVFYYSDETAGAEASPKAEKWNCFVDQLSQVRNGTSLSFDSDAIGCAGGRRHLGFTDKLRPNFNYFLSCGNDEIEGERYLRTPEIVEGFLKNAPWKPAKASRIVFKRWDKLSELDEPEIVIFYANPDVLSALFTLAGFDRDDMIGSITPFGSGCNSIVQYPLAQAESNKPNAIIGMFDISARPSIEKDKVTFAVPYKRFCEIVSFFDESFLITGSWQKVRARINGEN